ncbi:MAG: UDP-N-acetylglucosamine 2-epimerase (hydrolyzing) [Flavobacteriaceae bacterium]|nr:UDP-N-acetylglucosamine 2-epimerase (hydrolyzing) [Flavobacteriaceae bacterium]
MKKIVFLTGTRADFGKLKSLMSISQKSDDFEVHIFVTGMHMNSLYGLTVDEIQKAGFKNIYKYINHDSIEYMDRTLAKTIVGFSQYIAQINPDLIVVHGDRVEALAGAIVGSLNNILVAHIEGGEVSGTIDELIRHSVTKMSHIHLVANSEAKKRLIQLGEFDKSIFILGSPDLDLMDENSLPNLELVMNYYNVSFDEFAIAMFHPITTEYNNIKEYARNFVEALVKSQDNYILIYPNNDLGSKEILEEIRKVENLDKIKVFPSLRFEYFLRLLKESKYIIGNSSAGIREAPYYNVPTVDIGTRQNNRAKLDSIFNCNYDIESVLKAIGKTKKFNTNKIKSEEAKFYFGKGRSDSLFLKLLHSQEFWNIEHQKQFQEVI